MLPIENLPLTHVLIRVCNRSLQERHRTALSREQMSLWLAGYSKTPGFDVQFGVILDRVGPDLASGRLPLHSDSDRSGTMPPNDAKGHKPLSSWQKDSALGPMI